MKSIIGSGIAGFVFLIGYLFFTSSNEPAQQNTANNEAATSQQVMQVHIPDQLDFAGEALPMHDYDVRERFDREITSITFRHSHTIRILKIANRWMPMISEILATNGVPDDFKYLAAAESGFENLVSPAGAKGVWQFMSATAKQYGMEVSEDVEERYHVEKATIAACQYLKKAKERFGTWTMAAAAYNRGSKGMSTQVKNQKSDNYYDLYLNRETYRYIFRILAYKQLMQNPDLYGFHFSSTDLYHPIQHKTVMVSGIPSIGDFAKQHNTSYKHIKLLNPWMKTYYLRAKGNKQYAVKVPIN